MAYVSCILIVHSSTASHTATAPNRQALHIAARAELSLITVPNELWGLVCQRPLRIQLDDPLPLPHLLHMLLLLLLQLKAHHLLRRMIMMWLLLSKLVLILVCRGMGGPVVSDPRELLLLLRVAEAALAVRLVEGGCRRRRAADTVSFKWGWLKPAQGRLLLMLLVALYWSDFGGAAPLFWEFEQVADLGR